MHQKINARKRARKGRDRGDEIGHFWSHFDELKTVKSIEKQTLFLTFVIFGKVEKQQQFLELILDPFWELKTFKNHWFYNVFLIFVIFGKVEKKTTVLELILVDSGAHWSVLELIWKSAAPKTFTFRVTAIAG